MHIKEGLAQVKNIAVKVGGFIRRHKRASITTVAALLIIGPLLTGVGGEAFIINLVGLGIGALLVRQFTRPRGKRRQAQQTAQQKAKQQKQGGTA